MFFSTKFEGLKYFVEINHGSEAFLNQIYLIGKGHGEDGLMICHQNERVLDVFIDWGVAEQNNILKGAGDRLRNA